MIRKMLTIFVCMVFTFGCASREPDITISSLEKARHIEHTLLMSDLTVLGILSSLENSLSLRQDKSRLLGCFKENGGHVISTIYAVTLSEALTKSELDYGYSLANKPVFPKVNAYIINNRKKLSSDYDSSNKVLKMDEFFLVEGSKNMNLSDSDKKVVADFVVWHRTISSKVVASGDFVISSITQETSRVLDDCGYFAQ